jgi:hypothetical protein
MRVYHTEIGMHITASVIFINEPIEQVRTFETRLLCDHATNSPKTAIYAIDFGSGRLSLLTACNRLELLLSAMRGRTIRFPKVCTRFVNVLANSMSDISDGVLRSRV